MEIKFGFKGVPGTVEMVQHQVDEGWRDIIARLIVDLEALGWNGEVVQVSTTDCAVCGKAHERFHVKVSSTLSAALELMQSV